MCFVVVVVVVVAVVTQQVQHSRVCSMENCNIYICVCVIVRMLLFPFDL